MKKTEHSTNKEIRQEQKPDSPLGGAALTLVDNEPVASNHFIEVTGGEPLYYAPAGAKPYLGQAKRGIELKSATAPQQALDYATSLFPNEDFSMLGGGKHGVALTDNRGKVYKISRTAHEYSRTEQEAGALQLLSDAGLAPRLHALVDAGRDYRIDTKAYDYVNFGFEDVVIPRISTGRELPVIVMDFVDVAPLESATKEALIGGLCKTIELFVKKGIHCWDAEFGVNKANGEIILIDAGELYQTSLINSSVDKNPVDDIIDGICLDFGLYGYSGAITAAYSASGIDGVIDYLQKIK